RSIRLASSTSWAAVSSACRPASRRNNWRASVVDSTATAAGGNGGGGATCSISSSTTSIPRCSSSRYTGSTSSGSSSNGSSNSFSSEWRTDPVCSAASSSCWSSSLARGISSSTLTGFSSPEGLGG